MRHRRCEQLRVPSSYISSLAILDNRERGSEPDIVSYNENEYFESGDGGP